MKRFVISVLACLVCVLSISYVTHGATHSQPTPIYHNGLWGFADAHGNIVINPQYLAVTLFNHFGVAVVTGHNGMGVINIAGNPHTCMNHRFISSFDEAGHARFSDGQGIGIIDAWGNIIVPLTDILTTASPNPPTSPSLPSLPTELTSHEALILQNILALPYENRPVYVEKAEWFTDLRYSLPRNTPIHVFDLLTGITYYVASFSNGNHADVETLTIHDTESLFAAAGGQSWDGRPVWVTVNGRTIAAAIHSMPHDISTINDNGLNGHICLHFYGSLTHNTRQPVHASVITQAYAASALLQLIR